MLGTGFAFALMPGLRRVYADDPEGYEAAVRRHLEHFNAHPYLVGVALGATLRMEEDGASPETVHRFKVAVRGPLGSLGDQLVWATWLPLVAMASLVLYWAGVPGPWVVGVFLVLYNLGHLALRVWGLEAGLKDGHEVARRLAGAALDRRASRLRPVAALVVGMLCGVIGAGGLADVGLGWVAAGAVAFVVGLVGGHRVWRPAAVATVGVVVLISLLGVLP
jgi:mannose/fructose/N-acetylgalactosamine-specific phosphotransferase system component IID